MAADPAIGLADGCVRPAAGSRVQAVAENLFERHGERVLAYCRRRLRTPEDAEDALQTTFLYACRGLERGVVPETEIAWLLKIAHNVCLSQWDADRRRRRLELVQDPDRIAALTPAAARPDRENMIALEAALGRLTELQRRAILLREWRGLSYREIAAELRLTATAVETLLFRARRSLACSLDREVGRTRTTLAGILDLGGLLSSLKSALGLGGGGKVAATLALGAAVLASTIPDVPRPDAAEAPAPATVRAPRTAPALATALDPVLSPAARLAAGAEHASGAGKGEARRGRGSAAKQAGGPSAPPPLEVAAGLGGTVGNVTETATGVADDVAGDVLPEVVPPVDEVVGEMLGPDSGGLLPRP